MKPWARKTNTQKLNTMIYIYTIVSLYKHGTASAAMKTNLKSDGLASGEL